MMKLSATALLLLVAATLAHAEEACKAGESKKDGCNTCVCIEGAGWACTKRFCPRPQPEAETCSPGTTFRRDCNTCVCGRDGRPSACTLIGCLPPREVVAEAADSCTPGTTFKDDCNTCQCGPEGDRRKSPCTMMACPH